MCLPEDFQFSQYNLQDYADCARRFQLRHVLGVAWPAARAEPIAEWERRARLGQHFHRMAHQHALGVPTERLAAPLADADLRRWWHNFVHAPPRDLPAGIRRAEVTLSASLGNYRLIARYDLLAADPGDRLVIIDWKTHRPKNPSHLLRKLQSVVYPVVLVEAGAVFNGGGAIQPQQVTMLYWFADFPDDPLTLAYDAVRHAANHEHLLSLVREIEARCRGGDDTWPLTQDERACKFCAYRSLCDRGGVAGDVDDLDDETDVDDILDIDIDQVAEIAFQ